MKNYLLFFCFLICIPSYADRSDSVTRSTTINRGSLISEESFFLILDSGFEITLDFIYLSRDSVVGIYTDSDQNKYSFYGDTGYSFSEELNYFEFFVFLPEDVVLNLVGTVDYSDPNYPITGEYLYSTASSLLNINLSNASSGPFTGNSNGGVDDGGGGNDGGGGDGRNGTIYSAAVKVYSRLAILNNSSVIPYSSVFTYLDHLQDIGKFSFSTSESDFLLDTSKLIQDFERLLGGIFLKPEIVDSLDNYYAAVANEQSIFVLYEDFPLTLRPDNGLTYSQALNLISAIESFCETQLKYTLVHNFQGEKQSSTYTTNYGNEPFALPDGEWTTSCVGTENWRFESNQWVPVYRNSVNCVDRPCTSSDVDCPDFGELRLENRLTSSSVDELSGFIRNRLEFEVVLDYLPGGKHQTYSYDQQRSVNSFASSQGLCGGAASSSPRPTIEDSKTGLYIDSPRTVITNLKLIGGPNSSGFSSTRKKLVTLYNTIKTTQGWPEEQRTFKFKDHYLVDLTPYSCGSCTRKKCDERPECLAEIDPDLLNCDLIYFSDSGSFVEIEDIEETHTYPAINATETSQTTRKSTQAVRWDSNSNNVILYSPNLTVNPFNLEFVDYSYDVNGALTTCSTYASNAHVDSEQPEPYYDLCITTIKDRSRTQYQVLNRPLNLQVRAKGITYYEWVFY